jgi:hypothetical protein
MTKVLVWLLYGMLVFVGAEMALHPDSRFRLAAAAFALLIAIGVVTGGKEIR